MLCKKKNDKVEVREMQMDSRSTRKLIWIFLLICLPVSNILWYTGYSVNAQNAEDSMAVAIIMLTSFLPALTALVMTKVTGEGWDSLGVLPNIRKSWKVYIFSVAVTWIMVYLSDPLMLLLFKGNVTYASEGQSFRGWCQVLLLSLLAVVCSVEMLGEEIGWLGYLFPKLEKLHGTNAAILLLSLIRTLWHIGILVFLPHPVIGAIDLLLSNTLSQSFLVYITKRSSSLFPAAVVHAMTNLLPIFLVYSDEFYNDNIIAMNCTGLVSAAVVGVSCYVLMCKKKMISKKIQSFPNS